MTVAATQTSLSCPKHDALLPQSLLYNIITSKLSEAFELTSFHVNISHYSDNLGLVKREDEGVNRPSYRFTEFTQSEIPHLDLLLPTRSITPFKNNNNDKNCYSPDTYHAPKRQRLNSLARTPSSPDVRNIIGLTTKKPETNENVLQCPNCKQQYKHKGHFNNHIKNCTIPMQKKSLMAVCRELTYEKDNKIFASDCPVSMPSGKSEPASDMSVSDPLSIINKHNHTEHAQDNINDITNKDVGEKDECHISEHSYAKAPIEENDKTNVQFRFVDNEMVAYFEATAAQKVKTEDSEQQKSNANLQISAPETRKETETSDTRQSQLSTNTSQLSRKKKLAECEKQCNLKYSNRPKRLAATKNSHCKTKKVQSAAKILKNVKKCKQVQKIVNINTPSSCKSSPLLTPAPKKLGAVPNGRHACSECSCKFEAIWSLKRHEYTVHGIGVPLTSDDVAMRQKTSECQTCIMSPTSLTNIFNKMCQEVPNSIQQGSDKNWFKCGLCGLKYNSRAVLTRHKRSHKDPDNLPAPVDGKYLCYICYEKFDTSRRLQYHEAQHKIQAPTCSVCNNTFPSYTMLKSHKCLLKTDVQIKCTHCSAVFTSGSAHAKHLKLAHANLQQTFRTTICKLCDYTFSSVLKYKVHRTTAHPTPDFTCQLCFATSPSKDTLVNHVIREHRTSPFLCTVCEKGFNDLHALTQHKSEHFK